MGISAFDVLRDFYTGKTIELYVIRDEDYGHLEIGSTKEEPEEYEDYKKTEVEITDVIDVTSDGLLLVIDFEDESEDIELDLNQDYIIKG